MFSRFSRRQFISVISLSIAGATVASGFPFLKNFFIGKAQAQEISEEVYKGRKYKIVTDITPQADTANTTLSTQTELFLDGKRVKIVRHSETKKYMTPLLFGVFNSPEEVAKILIDMGIKLPGPGEVQVDSNVD